MPRLICIDTYYPQFLSTIGVPKTDAELSYESALQDLIAKQFGTSNFYTKHLSNLGWQCADVVANFEPLQRLWARENGRPELSWPTEIALTQIEAFRPDCVFLQDLSFFNAATLEMLRGKYILAGQCSCPLPPIANVKAFHWLATSFPHYVKKFQEVGVKATYVPLAFEPSVIAGPQLERDIDVSFCGGVGRNSHWRSGTDVLEAVAAAFKERFHWYGYGLDRLSASSALRSCYRGEAWGKDMFSIYRRSKIVVNRHGEIANGFANNMRMFEATGMGAMLLTESAPNLTDFFTTDEAITYDSPETAVHAIQVLLDNPDTLKWTAENGQRRTLSEHTYRNRMEKVSAVLKEML